jgi:polar amino acid transport system permease protein
MAFGIKTKDVAAFFDIRVGAVLFWFVAVAFVINYACYFSEIYRAGIQSIPAGQYEAGKVLGLTKNEIFFKIILVQALKRIVPPMGNEIITLVKDTALAQILGVVDLLNAANHAVNEFVVLTPFLYASIFYLIFNGLLTLLFSYVERKFEWFKV